MNTLLFASLGTDHHPFRRLVNWLDDVAAQQTGIEVIVQHGHTPAPLLARGRAFLPHTELLDTMRSAAVVICHGGPGTIMDAHRAGRRPIVVPRDPALGEHVDGHQLRFARAMLTHGAASVATDRTTFDQLLAQAILHPDDASFTDTGADTHMDGLATLGTELDALPHQPSRWEPVLRSARRVMHR